MPNAFTNAVGATVDKAKKKVAEYTQAAKDLAAMPGKIEGTVALKGPTAAYDKAEMLQKKSRKKGY